MTDTIFSDRAFLAARFALDGLARRSEVIGNNVANVDTPGFRAQTLSFEKTLASMLNKDAGTRLEVTQPGHLTPAGARLGMLTEARRGGSQRADGNNVDVDIELNQMAETGVRYQALTQLVNKKFTVLKAISMGR